MYGGEICLCPNEAQRIGFDGHRSDIARAHERHPDGFDTMVYVRMDNRVGDVERMRANGVIVKVDELTN